MLVYSVFDSVCQCLLSVLSPKTKYNILDVGDFHSQKSLKYQWDINNNVYDWDTVIFHLSASHLFGNLRYSKERQKPECLSRLVRAAGNPGIQSELMV